VGIHTAEVMVKYYKNLDQYKNIELEELIKINEVGPKIAESIIFFFSQKENVEIIKKLREAGLNFETNEEEENIEDRKIQRLQEKQFVLTGTLKDFTRSQAKKIINQLGGRVAGSVSKNTNYVVVGEDPGSKISKKPEN